MKILKKRLIIIVIVLVFIVAIGLIFANFKKKSSTSPSQNNLPSSNDLTNLTTSGNAKVDWDRAISILRSGEVEEISQFHNLVVILNMRNGDQITTNEPNIDEIIIQIELCGETCKNIIISTE